MDVLCRLRRLLCHSRIINAEIEQRLVNSTITDVEIKERLVNDKIINAESFNYLWIYNNTTINHDKFC